MQNGLRYSAACDGSSYAKMCPSPIQQMWHGHEKKFKGSLENFVKQVILRVHPDTPFREMETEIAAVLKKSADWHSKRQQKKKDSKVIRRKRSSNRQNDNDADYCSDS